MALTDNEKEILSLLGYRKAQIVAIVLAAFRQDLLPYELTRVADIRTELTTLDLQIKEGLSDSAVIQTCKTEMNWIAHIQMLRAQGHRLLLELARIYDVEVAFSKYLDSSASGSGSGSGSGNDSYGCVHTTIKYQ
jgi:hypothetical protein